MGVEDRPSHECQVGQGYPPGHRIIPLIPVRIEERRAFFRGEGRWHPPEGEYVYIELELMELEVNRVR